MLIFMIFIVPTNERAAQRSSGRGIKLAHLSCLPHISQTMLNWICALSSFSFFAIHFIWKRFRFLVNKHRTVHTSAPIRWFQANAVDITIQLQPINLFEQRANRREISRYNFIFRMIFIAPQALDRTPFDFIFCDCFQCKKRFYSLASKWKCVSCVSFFNTFFASILQCINDVQIVHVQVHTYV